MFFTFYMWFFLRILEEVFEVYGRFVARHPAIGNPKGPYLDSHHPVACKLYLLLKQRLKKNELFYRHLMYCLSVCGGPRVRMCLNHQGYSTYGFQDG